MTGSVIGLVAALCGQPAAATPPVWLNAYEVKVRAAGQSKFAGAGRVGVEFFRDPLAGAVLAVSDKGRLAVAPAGEAAAGKEAKWLFAYELQARGPDEEPFSPKTKTFGVEGYKDQLTGKLLYLTQGGGVALADYPAAVLADKGAKFHHALVLKVRGAAEDSFDKAKRVGVEVYRDENTGGLVYVTDAGFLAAAPAPADLKAGDAGRKPVFQYGLPLRVRKAAETAYTDRTARVGVEVYRDAATGHLIYVTEAGGIAVVAAPAVVDKGKNFREERGLLLTARPAGEARFEKGTRIGVEVVTDNNTGHTVYLADTGAIAVLAKK